MDCEQVARDELVEKYLSGQLEPTLQRDLQVHILECPECLALLETCEDIRDDLAPRAAAIRQKSEKRSWSLGPLLLSWRSAALAGLACVVVVAAVLGVRTGWISGHGMHNADGTVVTSEGGKPATFLEISALSPAEQSAVRRTISDHNISYPPELSDLRGKPGTLLGESPGNEAFRVLEPLGEVVIEPRPLFRWQPIGGAVSYSVVIIDTKTKKMQSSPVGNLTQWQPAHPLQHGEVYEWQVTAVMSDGKSVIAPAFPNPKAKFRVIDQTRADELERFRQTHPEAHLVLGIVYAEAGILKDAEQEFSEVPENSRDFELAQNFLRNVRKLRQGS